MVYRLQTAESDTRINVLAAKVTFCSSKVVAAKPKVRVDTTGRIPVATPTSLLVEIRALYGRGRATIGM